MPALAVYIGAHDVTALLYKSLDDYQYYSFPYVYNQALYSNFSTETDFYKAIFEMFCKQSGLKLSDCDVLVTGFLEPPYLNLPLRVFSSLQEVIRSITAPYPILVNNFGIVTPDAVYSQRLVKPSAHKMKDVAEERATLANMSLYPNVVVSDIVSRLDLDSYLFSSLPKNFGLNLPTDDIVFMGSRFSKLYGMKEINYLFMFNLLSKQSVYTISVDPNNSLVLIQLLKMYLGTDIEIASDVVRLGTLVSSNNSLECLVNTQVGTSQIVELEKNKLFFVPIDKGEKAKIMLKITGGSTKELFVEGGSLGLMFDTRDKKLDIGEDFKSFNAALKSLGEVV